MVLIERGNLIKNVMWLQWTAGIGVMWTCATIGLMLGWTSPYLAKLTAEDSPLPLSMEEASWVASFLNFGRFVGAIIGGIVVQYFGSKQTLAVIGFPLMFAWICVIVANSVTWLYIGRIAAGMCIGMSLSSFPLYIGEVANPKIRGTLVSMGITGFALGTVVGNILGAIISMTLFGYIALVPTILFTCLFAWMPQSPHYLVRRERIEDAKKSILRYSPNVDAKIEVESLKDFISNAESLTFVDRLRELNLPRNRKAVFITLTLYLCMQFSGINTLVFYQEIIMTSAKVTVINPATIVMITGIIAVISGWIAVFIADKFQRKVLMVGSSCGVCVSLVALGAHFALLENGYDPKTLQWLPITGMIGFIFSVTNGITTVPNMIVSELFAPNIKNLMACISSIVLGLYAFIATWSFQPLIDAIGEAYVFWANAALMVFGVIFAGLFMPETKGKSLQQIQDDLMRK